LDNKREGKQAKVATEIEVDGLYNR